MPGLKTHTDIKKNLPRGTLYNNNAAYFDGVPHFSTAADIFYTVNYEHYFKVLYKLRF